MTTMTGDNGQLEPGFLAARARRIRRAVLQMAHSGRTPHVGSALSCVDLLVTLYSGILRIDPRDPERLERDRFLLSKGHGCMALYAVLAECGFFPASLLDTYARDGSPLAEHPGPHCVPGVELATGSLGHALSVGAGLALAARLRQFHARVFVLLSDAECFEGSVWEAALFSAANRLGNLVAIIDHNNLSAMGRTEPALASLPAKWEAFGWTVSEINGHDPQEIARTLRAARFDPGMPAAIIARTVKGKGVSFMEDDLEWHYRPPSDADLSRAFRELDENCRSEA